jgi:hypothetical protein
MSSAPAPTVPTPRFMLTVDILLTSTTRPLVVE